MVHFLQIFVPLVVSTIPHNNTKMTDKLFRIFLLCETNNLNYKLIEKEEKNTLK